MSCPPLRPVTLPSPGSSGLRGSGGSMISTFDTPLLLTCGRDEGISDHIMEGVAVKLQGSATAGNGINVRSKGRQEYDVSCIQELARDISIYIHIYIQK
jgi:hypothetical protein